MTGPSEQRDLLIVVADRNIEATVVGILSRPQALRIRPISFDVVGSGDAGPAGVARIPRFLACCGTQAHSPQRSDGSRAQTQQEAQILRGLPGAGGKSQLQAMYGPFVLEVDRLSATLGWGSREP